MEPTRIHAFRIRNISNLHVYGRTSSYRSALPLFWTGSGFSVDTKSGELWALLESDYSVYEPWVSVWVNGNMVGRFMVEKGRRWYCLFRGLSPEKVHRFELLKETQAMSGDRQHMLLVHALGVPENIKDPSSQVFLKQKERPVKIEFVGDSITTGEGLSGGVDEMDWISGWMSLKDNYALMTAKALNADFHILSQCGWGVTASWDNDRKCILPPHYTNVCSMHWGERNEILGAQDDWDFSKWKSDFVVVNLGTNDWGAFNNPMKTDPGTGEKWKYRIDADGKPNPDDLAYFRTGVMNFIKKIRVNNPNAHIIWIYGMCGFELGGEIAGAVETFASENSDSKVHFMHLPSMTDESSEEKGSRSHPGPGTHRRVARLLTEKIASIMKAEKMGSSTPKKD